MFLTEYQAKELLVRLGLPIPEGRVARTPDEAEAVARSLDCQRFAVKAQIRAGGRGLAQGIKFAATPSTVRKAAEELIGRRLVTAQTGPEGLEVASVTVEAAIDMAHSLYLAMVIDQRSAVPTLLGSYEGNVEFEAKAAAEPEIVKALPLPDRDAVDGPGMDGFLEFLGVSGAGADSVRQVCGVLADAFWKTDAGLIEINPLGVQPDGRAIAIDAKMIVDDNALFRHPEFELLKDEGELAGAELIAQENDINFMKLGGDIGLVVNGAGLGLATLDMVVDAGGRPANFMDIRTTATSLKIAKGIGLLLDEPGVKVLLVNIHGGGMTVCDTIAEALNFAYRRAPRKPPIVYRAAGQNAAWSQTIMEDRRLPYERHDDLSAAVARAVEIAGGRR